MTANTLPAGEAKRKRSAPSAGTGELEKLRIQLAACLTAAEGHRPKPPLKRDNWAWSVAYHRTLELRQDFDFLKAEVSRLQDDNYRLRKKLRAVPKNGARRSLCASPEAKKK